MKKVKTIEIGGRLWPMAFSLYCYENNEDLLKNHKKRDEIRIEAALNMVYSMIVSGCKFCSLWGYRPDGVDFDKNGKIEPMSKEAFLVAIQGQEDINLLMDTMNELIGNGAKPELNAVPIPNPAKKKRPKRR